MRFYALQFTLKYKNQPCTAIFHSVIHLKHVKSCMGIDKVNNILISFLAGPNVEISHHWLSTYLKRGEFSSLFLTENARIDLLYTPKLTKNPESIDIQNVDIWIYSSFGRVYLNWKVFGRNPWEIPQTSHAFKLKNRNFFICMSFEYPVEFSMIKAYFKWHLQWTELE